MVHAAILQVSVPVSPKSHRSKRPGGFGGDHGAVIFTRNSPNPRIDIIQIAFVIEFAIQ